MSKPDDYGKEEWLNDRKSGRPVSDPFEESARRGRGELSQQEAADLLSDVSEQLREKYGKQPTATRRLKSYRWLAAACILILLTAGITLLLRSGGPNNQDLFTDNFTPYANELSGRSMGEETSSDLPPALANALLAYDREDFTAAVEGFERYFANGVIELPAERLYYGISLLGANQPARAEAVLIPLIDDAEYGRPASWYRALATLRGVSPQAATPHLRAVAQDPSSPFRERARIILQELE